MTQRDKLQGLWRRSLIAWPDGRRDTTTTVAWLQGPTFYADLRQPSGPLPTVRCLRELSLEDALSLARQEGFAGTLLQHDDCFEWTRLIDYQPRALYSDRGTLDDLGDVMIEDGCEMPYTEHWHRAGGGPPPCAAVRLRDRETGCQAMIVRSGDRFMMARDRARPLADLPHLTVNVEAAGCLEDAQDVVDCELSIGHVRHDGWIIDASSLPWRVGAHLAPCEKGGHLLTEDVGPEGAPMRRRWILFEIDGRVDDLLAPSPAEILIGDAAHV